MRLISNRDFNEIDEAFIRAQDLSQALTRMENFPLELSSCSEPPRGTLGSCRSRNIGHCTIFHFRKPPTCGIVGEKWFSKNLTKKSIIYR
jgi:uncharacterized protein with von Willebrand factor type A (vWA) domain